VAAEAEMRMLEKFRHPHVVRYHASFQTESLTCIVMEYCSDGTLADLINQQREATAGSGFPQPQALDLWVQVRFLHAAQAMDIYAGTTESDAFSRTSI
jgi:serine/threonine protein kinase